MTRSRTGPVGPAASTDPDLAELLGLAARGSETAFAAVYDATAGRAFGLALSIVQDPVRAEEACRRAFLDIWRGAAERELTDASAMAWILLHVRRQASGTARVDRSGDAEPGAASAPVPAATDPTRAVTRAGASALRVRAVLDRLPVDQRRAVELAYLRGRTSAEVAELTGSTTGTAQLRLRLALVELHAGAIGS